MSNSKFQLNHIAIATILLCWLVILIKLGLPELLPYSEAVTAFRAEAILQHKATLDQTIFSPSGISSSAKPPLTSWIVSISMYVFGESNFALRFPIALLSLGILILWYVISSFFIPRKYALFSPILLTGTSFFTTASRTIEPTIASIFFLLLLLYIAVSIERKQFSVLLSTALIAVIVLFLFLNEFYSGIAGITLLLPFIIKETKHRQYFIGAIAFGFLASTIWFFYLFSLYGVPFIQSYFLIEIFKTTVFQKLQSLNSIFFIDSPILLLGLFFFFNVVKTIQSLNASSISLPIKTAQLSLVFWFLSAIGIYFFTPTFSSTSSVILVIPLLFLAILTLHSYLSNTKQTVFFISLLLTVFFNSIWNILRYFLIKDQTFLQIDFYVIVFIVLISLGFAILLKKRNNQKTQFTVLHWLFIVLPIVFVGKQFLTNIRLQTTSLDGATSVGMYFKQGCELPFVYLYHQEHTFSYDAPQLAWCSRSSLEKLVPQKTYTPIFLSTTVLDNIVLDALIKPEFYDKPIVYHYINSAPIKAELVKELSKYRQILTEQPSYIVFGSVDKMKLLFNK